MSFINIFVPKQDLEDTVRGRIGEVLYWIGSIFGLVALYYLVLGDVETAGGCFLMFILGRSMMYILSGR